MSIYRRHVAHTGIVLFVLAGTMRGQQANLGYDDTPMQPNGRWHVHDVRTSPTVVRRGVCALASRLHRLRHVCVDTPCVRRR